MCWQAQLTTLQQNADENAYTAQWQRQEFEASLTVVETPCSSGKRQSDLSQFTQSVSMSGMNNTSPYSAYPAVSVKPATNYSQPTPAPVSYAPVQQPTTYPPPSAHQYAPVQQSFSYTSPAQQPVSYTQPPVSHAPVTQSYQYNLSSYPVVAPAPSTTPAQYNTLFSTGQPVPSNMSPATGAQAPTVVGAQQQPPVRQQLTYEEQEAKVGVYFDQIRYSV
jgi:hypothetical protein